MWHPEHVYVEGSLLYGQTTNEVSPLGTFTDTYSSDRIMANFKMSGEVDRAKFTFRPNVELNYVSDNGESYTDGLGNAIQGYTTELGQAAIGFDTVVPLDISNGQLDLLFGTSVIYGFSSGSGSAANVVSATDGGRARLDAGLAWAGKNSNAFRLNVFYDGLGASSYEAYGVDLNYSINF